MTNADKIRSMTDEELAKLLDDSLEFFSCNDCEKLMKPMNQDCCEDYLGFDNYQDCCNDCESWILKFLQKNV